LKKDYNLLENLVTNYKFLFTQAFIIGVQYLIINYGGEITQCTPLSWNEHAFCAIIASGTFIAWFLAKFIPRNWFNFVFL